VKLIWSQDSSSSSEVSFEEGPTRWVCFDDSDTTDSENDSIRNIGGRDDDDNDNDNDGSDDGYDDDDNDGSNDDSDDQFSDNIFD
jgi:hypothetical protein